MATVTSGAGMSALLQKASQQYLECRRKVTSKTEEVKDLETQIQWIFARINESSAATKSVGRLELKIVAIEGEAPVDDAVVSVEIDPEYEEPAPAAKAAEEAEDKADDESPKVENAEEEEKKIEEEEEKTEEKEPVVDEAPKEKVRRSVLWKDAEGLPLEVVFDPVQSREAVVTIAIAPPATDGEESEPVKEFRVPVSSLFQTGSINRWYVLKKVEHVHVDKAAVTEVADQDEATKEKTEEAEDKPAEEAEDKPAEEAENKPAEEAAEEKAADEAEDKAAEPTEDAPKTETAEPVAEDTEKKGDDESPAHLVAAEASVESEDKVVVVQEGKLHVQIHFTMSEIEKLSQTAIALSQQKQEAEAVLAVLDREAASLRVKYERLSASQRSLSASGGVVKPRSTLLGGRGLGAAPVRAEKSTYQKVKDSVAAVFTPQRTQVLTSFAIFCGSVALFHFQGDNLLA